MRMSWMRSYRQRGWTAVDPETLPLAQQIQLFSSARAVCGVHGAGLTNMVWCPPGCRIIELMADNYLNGCFESISACLDVQHAYLVFPGDAERRIRVELDRCRGSCQSEDASDSTPQDRHVCCARDLRNRLHLKEKASGCRLTLRELASLVSKHRIGGKNNGQNRALRGWSRYRSQTPSFFRLGFSRLRGDLDVSRAALLPRASRHQGALPADDLWWPVGCGPAVGSGGNIHARLWASGRRVLPGRAVSVVRLYRSGALDVVLFGGRYGFRQSRRRGGLISKVYFPRIIVPLASAASFLLDFAIGLVLLAVMLVYYAVTPSIAILLLPFFSAMAFVSAFAVGMWLSALNVRYRDVRYVVPFLLQLLLFASPLGYPVTDIHGFARILYALNPVTGFAEGFRWTVLGLPQPPLMFLIVPTLVTFVLLVTGLVYFRKTERSFADVV